MPLAHARKTCQITKLPTPKRAKPNALTTRPPKQKNQFSIENIKLSGKEWTQFLSLLCSVIQDEEHPSLEIAKTVALDIDQYLQNTEKFKAEVEALKKTGGDQIEALLERFKIPPWER